MQLPERYWEGQYWEGLTPESLQAVPLDSAGPGEDETHTESEMIREAIDKCKRYVEEKLAARAGPGGSSVSPVIGDTDDVHSATAETTESAARQYYLTVQDGALAPADVAKAQALGAAVYESGAGGDGKDQEDAAAVDVLGGRGKMVCLLWHYTVFLGARVRPA